MSNLIFLGHTSEQLIEFMHKLLFERVAQQKNRTYSRAGNTNYGPNLPSHIKTS